MGGFLPGLSDFEASNKLAKTQSMNAYHRHTEINSDGSKIVVEKSMDKFKGIEIKGSGWIRELNPGWHGKEDSENLHDRHDKEYTVIRTTTTLINKDGTSVVDEDAVRIEDESNLHGMKAIGSEPEKKIDDRFGSLKKFAENDNSFTMLGTGQGFTPLLDDKKGGNNYA